MRERDIGLERPELEVRLVVQQEDFVPIVHRSPLREPRACPAPNP